MTGKTLVLAPGRYSALQIENTQNMTILCEPGAWIGREDDAFAGGAAIWIKNADGIHVEGCHIQRTNRGIELTDTVDATIVNNSFSGHCMFIQAHSVENNPLNGVSGKITIGENVMFYTDCAGGSSHGIYLSGDLVGHCDVVNNRILRFSHSGHGIKFGCNKGLIEGNEVRGLDGRSSPPLDLMEGGEIVVRNNIFQIGPIRENSDLVRAGRSGRRDQGGSWEAEVHNLLFENNIWIIDGGSQIKQCWLTSQVPGTITLRNETFVGLVSPKGCNSYGDDPMGWRAVWDDPVNNPEPPKSAREAITPYLTIEGVTFFDDRVAAGLPSYEEQLDNRH